MFFVVALDAHELHFAADVAIVACAILELIDLGSRSARRPIVNCQRLATTSELILSSPVTTRVDEGSLRVARGSRSAQTRNESIEL